MSENSTVSPGTEQINQALPPQAALTDFAHLGADDQQHLEAIAQRVLESPVELEKLTDLVCQLLEQDIRLLSERGRKPGRN